jgi:hypothetical protein
MRIPRYPARALRAILRRKSAPRYSFLSKHYFGSTGWMPRGRDPNVYSERRRGPVEVVKAIIFEAVLIRGGCGLWMARRAKSPHGKVIIARKMRKERKGRMIHSFFRIFVPFVVKSSLVVGVWFLR